MINIHPIPALRDNYIWVITSSGNRNAVIVDPGSAKPVIDYLNEKNLSLQAILLTHHHWDHTNGVKELVDEYKCAVHGPGLHSDQTIAFNDLNLELRTIAIPGHTLDHTAYYTNDGRVFSGDMLFSAGCGRVFEGTMEQMYNSLQKLAQLPDETELYCGHEYTENNLKFAKAVEHGNKDIIKKLKRIAGKSITLPSTMGEEKLTNPFLRCEVPEVIAAAEKHAKEKLPTPVAVFTALRKWKDSW